MLEECLVRVISRILVKNNVYFDYEAVFILLPGSMIVSPLWPFFINMRNPKVSSHWLLPPRIQYGGVRENMRNHT